jgi:type IV pilus assembly protein PilE
MIGPTMNTNRSANTRHVSGFSLVELLIAIAIVGILMAIAVPGYREHVRRGAVEEALAQMRSGAVALEQYFLDNRVYFDAPCPAGTARFALSCALNAETYTITATGSGNVSGFVYTLNEQGVAATTGGDWGTNAACWIIRKGGSCGG